MGYEYIDMSIGGYEFQWVMNIAAPSPHIYRTCTIYQFNILINIYMHTYVIEWIHSEAGHPIATSTNSPTPKIN